MNKFQLQYGKKITEVIKEFKVEEFETLIIAVSIQLLPLVY